MVVAKSSKVLKKSKRQKVAKNKSKGKKFYKPFHDAVCGHWWQKSGKKMPPPFSLVTTGFTRRWWQKTVVFFYFSVVTLQKKVCAFLFQNRHFFLPLCHFLIFYVLQNPIYQPF